MRGNCNSPDKFIRVRRRLVAAVALLALAACGPQFFYNRLDWLTHYYLASQVSLDVSQASVLRANLREFMVWHRHSELPRYAAFLDRFADATAAPLEFRQLESARLEIEGFVSDAVVQGAPDTARWLKALRPEQVDELFASFAEHEIEKRNEHCNASPAERRAHTTRRFVDKVEDWTGSLRVSQRELIATRLASFEGDACLNLSIQQHSRIEFRALVDAHRGQPDFAARIVAFMTHPEVRWEANYRRAFEANRTRFMQLIVDLDHTLTPVQRSRAVQRMRGFATDLRELAAEERET
jgi:hypothetical protein